MGDIVPARRCGPASGRDGATRCSPMALGAACSPSTAAAGHRRRRAPSAESRLHASARGWEGAGMPLVPVPTLTDGVVTLRGHRDDDIERCWEQCQDPVSQAWTTVPVPYSRDDATRFVREAMPGGWASDQEWAFAVEVRSDGGGSRYAGTVSLRNEGDGRAEIAFGSHPDVRGQGVIERALRLLLDWGFAPHGRGLHSVIWWANDGNWPSRKLAWRLGFSFDGTVRRRLPQRGELIDGWVG